MSRQIWNNNDKNVIKDKIFSPLYGVRLLDGLFKDTFENNLGYLKSLDMDAMLYWFRVRAGKNAPGMPYRGHFEDNITGQTAGLFLMGAGHALRWHEDEEVRGRLNQIVAEIGDCAEADGYLMAVPQSEFGTREYPHYVRIWLTYGLTAAALAGHPEAFGLLRRWQDWFNHCDDLPVIRYLVLAFQGVVASTYLYNTPIGTWLAAAVERALDAPVPADPVDRGALRVLVLHHWRRLRLRHGVLPDRLLGEGWEGARARRAVMAALARFERPPLGGLAS